MQSIYLTLIYLIFMTSSNGPVQSSPAVPIQFSSSSNNIKSDVIVTKWNPEKPSVGVEENQPGWMRNQLMNFGKVASRVGNMMGSHATKITNALDKICEVIKTIVPLLAAICHVGQFGFCAATNEAPMDFSAAINPSMLNIDAPDK